MLWRFLLYMTLGLLLGGLVSALILAGRAQTMVDYSSQVKNAPISGNAAAQSSIITPPPTLMQSLPFSLQPDGSWLLSNVPLPANPFGGAAFSASAFIVVRNGSIQFPFKNDGLQAPLFNVVIQGQGNPFSVRITAPNAQSPLPWNSSDDVRVIWAQPLF